jgi:aspartate/methionine/tyrosine aminotransferase
LHSGSLQGAEGYFRISLTATDAMIKRALPTFAEVLKQAEIRKEKGKL